MKNIVKYLISLICIMVPSLYFGYLGKPAEMGIALIAGSIAATFLNLEKFQSFKGGGFEAQLKETKEIVEKALVTIEGLKEVITPLMFNTLHSITYMGRLSAGGPIKNKDAIRDKCENIISMLSIEDPDIEKLISQYNMYTRWDAYYEIERAMAYKVEDKKKYEEVRKQFQNNENRYKTNIYPTKQEIYSIFEKNGFKINQLEDIVQQTINNYFYRLENNKSIYELPDD